MNNGIIRKSGRFPWRTIPERAEMEFRTKLENAIISAKESGLCTEKIADILDEASLFFCGTK